MKCMRYGISDQHRSKLMTQRCRIKIVSLIGAPGSGKGTYGSMLASRIANCSFFSMGDLLREHSEKNQAVKETLQSGNLVDDGLVSDAVLQRLQQMLEGTTRKDNVLILDGFPRNRTQTKIISKWPRELQQMMALHVDVPDHICIIKLLGRRKCVICTKSFNVNGVDSNGFYMPPILPVGGSCPVECSRDADWKKRDDDSEETIKKRMKVYHEQTEPVLQYWSERERLLSFVPYNGVCDIDAIFTKLDATLEKI